VSARWDHDEEQATVLLDGAGSFLYVALAVFMAVAVVLLGSGLLP
jgi:hypothetical protein